MCIRDRAYVLDRFKFPGNKLIRNLFMVASLLPAVAMQVTVFNIMSYFTLVDHLYGYIIMSCGTDIISIYIFIPVSYTHLYRSYLYHFMAD